MTIATRPRCRHCGGNLFYEDEDGQAHCLLCDRPYYSWADYGRIGGLQTVLRHGREHMAEIGRRGGRPRLRQLPVPEAQLDKKEERLPNRLSELKELYKQKRGEFSCNWLSPGRSKSEFAHNQSKPSQ